MYMHSSTVNRYFFIEAWTTSILNSAFNCKNAADLLLRHSNDHTIKTKRNVEEDQDTYTQENSGYEILSRYQQNLDQHFIMVKVFGQVNLSLIEDLAFILPTLLAVKTNFPGYGKG